MVWARRSSTRKMVMSSGPAVATRAGNPNGVATSTRSAVGAMRSSAAARSLPRRFLTVRSIAARMPGKPSHSAAHRWASTTA